MTATGSAVAWLEEQFHAKHAELVAWKARYDSRQHRPMFELLDDSVDDSATAASWPTPVSDSDLAWREEPA